MQKELVIVSLFFVPLIVGFQQTRAPRIENEADDPNILVPGYEMPLSFSAESMYVYDLIVTGTFLSPYLPLAGGTMSGDINMGMNDITYAESITANSFVIPVTSSSMVGVITQNGAPLLQTYGSSNLFLGAGSGNCTLSGNQNIGIGVNSLLGLSSGSNNIAIGINALSTNYNGDNNIAIGSSALLRDYSGSNNVAVGAMALQENCVSDNTAFGSQALYVNFDGSCNTAVGKESLKNNYHGGANSAFGLDALTTNSVGQNNTAIGYCSGFMVLGDQNTCIGTQAGSTITTGSTNTMIGYNAGSGVSTASDVIVIGTIAGTDVSSRTYIANIRDTTTGSADAIPVFIDSNGQLGTLASSRRFKENIVDIGAYSEKLYDLRPVIFTYKTDETHRPQYGLIAQEVQKVMPELVVNDKDGQVYTVMYQYLPPLMLNELQKLHTCIQQQQYCIDEQQQLIDTLYTEFDEFERTHEHLA
jgi:hypothetical protein